MVVSFKRSRKVFTSLVTRLLISVMVADVLLIPQAEANVWIDRRERIDTASLPPVLPQQTLDLPTENKISETSLPDIQIFSSEVKQVRRKRWAKLVPSIRGAVPLELPEGLLSQVNIRDVYRGKKGPSVFLLEDVHLNQEAQTHLSKAIKSFGAEKGAEPVIVGLEGAFGDLVFDLYKKTFPSDVAAMVADSFFETGDISGPAHAGFTFIPQAGFKPLHFAGVDDERLYKKNVVAYKDTKNFKTSAQKKLDLLEEKVNALSKTNFHKDLAIFHALIESYRAGKIPFPDYLQQLTQYNIPTTMNVDVFLQAYRMEKTMDLPVIESERADVIQALVKKLGKPALDGMVQWSLAYQEGVVSFADYYGHVKDLCGKNGIDLRRTPHFDDYIRYVLLTDGIKTEALLKEAGDLEIKVYASLAETHFEKKLIQLSRRLYLAEQLIRFSLTTDQWEEYKAAEGLDLLPKGFLKPFEDFYTIADMRSRAMIKNLLKAKGLDAGPTQDGIAVLVAGGFHTAELASLLREKNISYLVASPKITKIEEGSGSQYLSVFDREKTPLEEIFEAQKLFVAPPVAGGTGDLTTVGRMAAVALAVLMAVHHSVLLPAQNILRQLGAGSARVINGRVEVSSAKGVAVYETVPESQVRGDESRRLSNGLTVHESIGRFAVNRGAGWWKVVPIACVAAAGIFFIFHPSLFNIPHLDLPRWADTLSALPVKKMEILSSVFAASAGIGLVILPPHVNAVIVHLIAEMKRVIPSLPWVDSMEMSLSDGLFLYDSLDQAGYDAYYDMLATRLSRIEIDGAPAKVQYLIRNGFIWLVKINGDMVMIYNDPHQEKLELVLFSGQKNLQGKLDKIIEAMKETKILDWSALPRLLEGRTPLSDYYLDREALRALSHGRINETEAYIRNVFAGYPGRRYVSPTLSFLLNHEEGRSDPDAASVINQITRELRNQGWATKPEGIESSVFITIHHPRVNATSGPHFQRAVIRIWKQFGHLKLKLYSTDSKGEERIMIQSAILVALHSLGANNPSFHPVEGSSGYWSLPLIIGFLFIPAVSLVHSIFNQTVAPPAGTILASGGMMIGEVQRSSVWWCVIPLLLTMGVVIVRIPTTMDKIYRIFHANPVLTWRQVRRIGVGMSQIIDQSDGQQKLSQYLLESVGLHRIISESRWETNLLSMRNDVTPKTRTFYRFLLAYYLNEVKNGFSGQNIADVEAAAPFRDDVTVLSVGQRNDPASIVEDVQVLQQEFERLAHDASGRKHDVVVVLHPGLNQDTAKMIRVIVGASQFTSAGIVDLGKDAGAYLSEEDGRIDYGKVLSKAYEDHQELQVVGRLINHKKSEHPNINLRTYARFPAMFDVPEEFLSSWIILMNFGLGWVEFRADSVQDLDKRYREMAVKA